MPADAAAYASRLRRRAGRSTFIPNSSHTILGGAQLIASEAVTQILVEETVTGDGGGSFDCWTRGTGVDPRLLIDMCWHRVTRVIPYFVGVDR